MVHGTPSLSGLAASIRGSKESTTFDCASITPSSLSNSIKLSLSSPLPLTYMIRLTFIVGAGKLNRSRYHDTLLRTVCHTLQFNLHYTEDRGASCIYECSGTYKIQHDTGKNIRIVLVFPFITGPNVSTLHINDNKFKLYDQLTEEILVQLSMKSFSEKIELMCPTWIQKKRCYLELLKEQSKYSIIQQKVFTGQKLTSYEQNVYNTFLHMDKKLIFLKSKLQNHITEKQLTVVDKQYILRQIEEKKQKCNNPFLHESSETLQETFGKV